MFLKSCSNSLHQWSTLSLDLYEVFCNYKFSLFDEAWGLIYREKPCLVVEGKKSPKYGKTGRKSRASRIRRLFPAGRRTLAGGRRVGFQRVCFLGGGLPHILRRSPGETSLSSTFFRGGPLHWSARRAPAVAAYIRGGRRSPFDSRFPNLTFWLPFSAQLCTFLTKHVKIPK